MQKKTIVRLLLFSEKHNNCSRANKKAPVTFAVTGARIETTRLVGLTTLTQKRRQAAQAQQSQQAGRRLRHRSASRGRLAEVGLEDAEVRQVNFAVAVDISRQAAAAAHAGQA